MRQMHPVRWESPQDIRAPRGARFFVPHDVAKGFNRLLGVFTGKCLHQRLGRPPGLPDFPFSNGIAVFLRLSNITQM